jgi:small subunit ribosomal protein S13
MVYLLNTEISERKPICSALQNIYGIGEKRAKFLCQKFGIKTETKLKDLPKETQYKIVNFIEKEYLIGNELKKFLIQINEDYVKTKTYRGSRIKNKLPRRGQRTHTNSRTVKNIR